MARPPRLTASLVVALLVGMAAAAPAAAGERRPTLAQLEQHVMCPTCHTLLALSDAPVAERMRVVIRRWIAAGDTTSEIEARLVADFGEQVLAAPPAQGFGLVAWLVPFVALLGIGGVVAVAARRWTRAVDTGTAPTGERPHGRGRVDADLARTLDQELARFDA
jgi:cytochrome c-type biogenesis protein CcmH/NrfF